MGTLLWRWNDDHGQEQKFLIPNSLYIPSGKCRLLSPQHWAQTRQGDQKHAQEITDAQNFTLSWGKSSYKLTTSLGKKNNVGTLYMTPGFNNFNLFCPAATEEHHDKHYPLQVPPNLVDDDEDECRENPDDATVQRQWHPSTDSVTPLHDTQEQPVDSEGDLNSEGGAHITQGYENQDTPQSVHLNTLPDQMTLPDTQHQVDSTSGSDAALLLRYHYKYEHISFKRLIKMAEQGIIPKRLKDTYIPACLACHYAKATKRPWRN